MNKRSSQQGFTLIELIIVIVLLAIIAKMASQMLGQGLNAFLMGQNVMNTNWQGQIALERLSRDLALVRSASDVSVNSATEFSFINVNGVAIDYKLSGTTLLLNSQVLADGVSNLSFTYYDQNGNAALTVANLRYVNVALSFNQQGVGYSVNTAVFLRNLSS